MKINLMFAGKMNYNLKSIILHIDGEEIDQGYINLRVKQNVFSIFCLTFILQVQKKQNQQ